MDKIIAVILTVVFALIAATVFALIGAVFLTWGWNMSIPALFGAHYITFSQSFGLLLVLRTLFPSKS